MLDAIVSEISFDSNSWMLEIDYKTKPKKLFLFHRVFFPRVSTRLQAENRISSLGFGVQLHVVVHLYFIFIDEALTAVPQNDANQKNSREDTTRFG